MVLPIRVQGVMYFKEKEKIEYLLIKRCKVDEGFWQGVTGSLEEGEKLKECLLREIQEELSITDIKELSDIKEVFQWTKKPGQVNTEYVYLVRLDRNVKITLSKEHDDYKWCSYNEAYYMLEKIENKKTLKMINEELTN